MASGFDQENMKVLGLKNHQKQEVSVLQRISFKKIGLIEYID
jgi:hypothetical protein